MNAKGTYGPAATRFLAALTALLPVLMLATGSWSGSVRAVVDAASKVRLELLARTKSVSGKVQQIVVRNGGVLRTGDGVQLRLQSDVKAYVYIIAYGSSHTAILLRPFSGRSSDALIREGQTAVIPASGDFLPLDGREGRETLFTIVSDEPLTDLAKLFARIEKHGDNLDAIYDMLNGMFPPIERLSFKHIGASPLVGVAPTAARSAVASAETQVSDDRSGQVGGASLLPPASGGWSVSSTQSLGAGVAAGTPTAPGATTAGTSAGASGRSVGAAPDAAGHQASAPASMQASAPAGLQAASPAGADGSAPVSAARRKARQAAGIDENQFRGILATLPASGQAEAPEVMRAPFKEQGVLAAEGSRIRALEAQVESGASWPSDDGGARKNIQN